MKQKIERILSQIEESKDISIISARNIGSHAWGLASENSDIDLGLIFKENHNPNTIGTQKESLDLESFETDLIDIKSWSLRRFAELMSNSNPSSLLFAGSTIRYTEEPSSFQYFVRVRT